MTLYDQETAAAVQDLEVRQIEMEVQRKQLEQVTNTLLTPYQPHLLHSALLPFVLVHFFPIVTLINLENNF